VLDIATLTTRESGPHLELLRYRRPKSLASAIKLNINDVAATRLVMYAESLDLTLERALRRGATRVSGAIVKITTGRCVVLRDPDGRFVELVGPND
jgi:hypothetical protein